MDYATLTDWQGWLMIEDLYIFRNFGLWQYIHRIILSKAQIYDINLFFSAINVTYIRFL